MANIGGLSTTSTRKPNVGGSINTGIRGGLGTSFKSLFSGAPNAPIQRATVGLPNRGDFGSPISAPTITPVDRAAFGEPSKAGLNVTAGAAARAQAGFRDPMKTQAFKNIMGLAGEQTGRQEAERSRHASDAAQRRGYAGGFEDEGREAEMDRMSALATSGFAGAEAVRQQEGEMYGKAIGAFTQLQTAYNQAKGAGDIAYAQALTEAHFKNAENVLKTAGLNMEQQLAYAGSLNEAKMLQAKLDQDFNNSLIDNNRYIQAQQQIAAQLLAQQMALEQRNKEFEFESKFKEKQFDEGQRQFDLNLKANPNTALRTFSDPRYAAGAAGRKQTTNRGSVFSGLY